MKKLFATLLALHHLFIAAPAFAQAQLGAGQVLGNSTATRAPAKAESMTAMFDRVFGTTRGMMIQRGASTWGAISAAILGGGITYVDSGIGACTAVGDGVTDDAPAIRACYAQVAALTNGGMMGLSCNKTYLMSSRATGGSTGPIFNPKSKVNVVGCGDSSVLKVANGMNTVTDTYYVFYPAGNTVADRVDNAGFYNFKIDNNGVNNRGAGAGTLYYNNINIGLVHGTNIVIENVTFANNPGSQNIAINGTQGANTIIGVSIRNTRHLDSCDVINAACTDHSSIFVIADTYEIIGNTCVYSSQSTKSTCWEQWGTGGVADSNAVRNYAKMANIASVVFGISTRDQVMSNNTGVGLLSGVAIWCDGVSSSTLRNVTIANNTFRQSVQNQSFFDWDAGVTANCASNIVMDGASFHSDVAAGGASVAPTVLLGRAYNQVIRNSTFSNGLGPAIGNGTFSTSTSLIIKNNVITDAGQTSTAGGRRGILINSGTSVLQAIVEGNSILNVASAYMTTCYDITLNASALTSSWVAPYQAGNCGTISSLTLGGNFVNLSSAGIPYVAGRVGPLQSTTAVAGAMLNTDSAFVPALTVTPLLGVPGTSRGSLRFGNLTSGTLELGPATGALGTSVVTFPIGSYNAVGDILTQTLTNKTLTAPVISTIVNTGTLTLPTSTDTLVGRATTDTLTNKTLGATTLSGTISGGGNQINNVIIGTTTPLAGTFTQVQTRGAANQGVDVLTNTGTNQINFRWNGTFGGYFSMSNVAGTITTQTYGEGTSDQYFAPTGVGAAFGFNTTTPTTAQTGNVGMVTSNGGFKHSVVTVANLPTCNAANAGARYGVSNANATTFLSTVAGGGANLVPVYCNGTNWVIGANDNIEPALRRKYA